MRKLSRARLFESAFESWDNALATSTMRPFFSEAPSFKPGLNIPANLEAATVGCSLGRP